MIAFTKDELISSSNISRNFGDLLNRLKLNQLDKIAVLRNNKVEAVVLSVNEYEKLFDNYDKIEHFEIAGLVADRLNQEYTPIAFDSILNEFGINDEDL
jgi:hypothetical protein